ncbi:MAG: hypothetical protein KGL67_02815 [Patescibacteria group bacterium]|nr:hypothetical protein [Patescibacteria group bacterium]
MIIKTLFIVFMVIAIVLGITVGLVYLTKSSVEISKNTSVNNTTSTPNLAPIVVQEKRFVVVRECDTPCQMEVGTDEFIDTGLKPALVKFNGRSEWFTLSGRRDDPIPADKFNSGQAQFASLKNAPSIRVQVKELR